MPRKKQAPAIEVVQQEVDVSGQETHASVQCGDIRLVTSTLTPLVIDKTKDTGTRYAFRIKVIVEDLKAYSFLEVKVNYFYKNEQSDLDGFHLGFTLMGTFCTTGEMQQAAFADFIKLYTLTILWPYAREYVSDQFRRVGNHEAILPIINPQTVTEKIIENNLVDVEIIKPEAQE